jgi:ADP-ribosylglycohydrolase
VKEVIADRIKGTILAAACGNSLGGACLGMTRKEIMFAGGVYGLHEFHEKLPRSLMPNYQPGELMADTLVALELAESLALNQGNLDRKDFKMRLSKLLENKEFLDAAPAAHCLLPLRRLCEPHKVGQDEEEGQAADSSHVSAAARAFPVGCLPAQKDVVQIAVEQAQLSQPDTRVAAGAAVLAHAVNRFVGGDRLDEESQVRTFVKEHFEIAGSIDERFASAWDDVAPDLNYLQPAAELPYSLINVDSHVNEAVPTAVGIFLIFRHNLEEAVAAAASSGGDTVTVAAIVGALSGAYHGASAIPERWLNQISHRDHLEKVADQLIGLW